MNQAEQVMSFRLWIIEGAAQGQFAIGALTIIALTIILLFFFRHRVRGKS